MYLGLRMWIPRFLPKNVDPLVWVSGLGLRILISAFGFKDLDIWFCVSEVGCMGLGLRICINGFGSQDLDLWVWMSEFVSQDLDLLVWV